MAHLTSTGPAPGVRPLAALRRVFWLPLLALALLAAGLIGRLPGTQAQTDPAAWAQIAGLPPTYTGYGVFLFNGLDNAWVVGGDPQGGWALRLARQYGNWTIADRATFRAPLRAVAVVNDDNVWAVGERGLIVHREAGVWREVDAGLGPNTDLLTLQMLGDGEEGWAAGVLDIDERGRQPDTALLHYQYGRWAVDTSIGDVDGIRSLHFGAGGGWAVGRDPWRYQAGGWTRESAPDPCATPGCYANFAGVRALSDDEAWAVGDRIRLCGICLPGLYAVRRSHNAWQRVLPDMPVRDLPVFAPNDVTSLTGLSFATVDEGLAVGWMQFATNRSLYHPLALRYHNGQWGYEALPPQADGLLFAVSHADATHALAVGDSGLILSYGYGPSAPLPLPTGFPAPLPSPTRTPLPSAPVPDPRLPGVLYFAATGHSLQGGFRAYWETHGGLAQFGYPLTEEFYEGGYTVQYFERNRFEWHPANRPPSDILLGLLGRTVTTGRENEEPFRYHPANGSAQYFPETGHTIAPQFYPYWDAHGGLPVYGYPISEPFTEINPADGRPYLVQYFERNRLEYHPELSAAFRVSLGLLGSEVLRARGWLP